MKSVFQNRTFSHLLGGFANYLLRGEKEWELVFTANNRSGPGGKGGREYRVNFGSVRVFSGSSKNEKQRASIQGRGGRTGFGFWGRGKGAVKLSREQLQQERQQIRPATVGQDKVIKRKQICKGTREKIEGTQLYNAQVRGSSFSVCDRPSEEK